MEKKNKNTANKEKIQGRLLFLIAAAILLAGIAGILGRNNSSDKFIGTVYVITNDDSSEIEGYKVQKQYEDKITEYDVQPIEEIENTFKVFEQPEEDNTAVSFTGNYVGDVLYSVYDMDYNEIYKDATSLKIPVGVTDGYIVQIKVKWGRTKNNVTLDYYFKINL